MMKNTLLLGKNYHSFLISFALFERNKKVVLVDDHLKDYEEGAYLWDFEINILKTWGLDCKISQLLDLSNYLSPGPYTFIFDGKHLNLGGSPGQNYNEILRKFPSLLSLDPLKDDASRKKFDKMFESFSEKFGVKLFRFIGQSEFKMEMVWELLPPELKTIFQDFKAQSKKEELKYLCCFFQGIYQHQFFSERPDFLLLFIILFLISPRFELNRKKFEEDLLNSFKKHGGEVVSSEKVLFKTDGSGIHQFEAPGKDPLNLEKLFLTSGEFLGVSLVPDSNFCYTSLKIRLHLKNPELLKNEFFVSGTGRLGGDYPLTRFKFEKDGLIGEVLIPYMPGSKSELEEKNALKILLNDIKEVLGDLPGKELRPESILTQKFWSHDFGKKSVSFFNWPYFPKPVKNLNVFHPLKSGPLGNLSVLSQIKDERGHIL